MIKFFLHTTQCIFWLTLCCDTVYMVSTMYWIVSWCTTSNVPVTPPVRRADELVLAAGLVDDGDERFEQDLVILPFFVLPASPRVADSAPPLVFDVSLPADDKLLELPDSLPFNAATTVTPLQRSATRDFNGHYQ